MVRKRHCDELAYRQSLRRALDAWFADEPWLVEFHGPRHVQFGWSGVEVGVLPDDNVPFFETQKPQSVETVGADVEIATALDQRLPEVKTLLARMMKFVRQFSNETEADRATGSENKSGAVERL